MKKKVLTFDPKDPRCGRPHLECPGVPSIWNEHTLAVHQESIEWAIKMGLVPNLSCKAYQKLHAAQISKLAGRTYPHASYQQLRLVTDFITLLCFYDDECRETVDVGRDMMAKMESLEDKLVKICRGTFNPAEERDPDDNTKWHFIDSLADICDRVRAMGPRGADWLQNRLVHNMHDYIAGCRWERHLKLQENSIPSLATYSRLRPLISAVFCCLDLTGLCVDGLRTEDINRNPLIHQMEIIANNHVSWVDDIYGISKELCEGHASNIVVVLRNDFGLAWDEAIDLSIDMCNKEFQAFCDLEALFMTQEKQQNSPVRRYVMGMKFWMCGNLDSYNDTKRYKMTNAAALSVDLL